MRCQCETFTSFSICCFLFSHVFFFTLSFLLWCKRFHGPLTSHISKWSVPDWKLLLFFFLLFTILPKQFSKRKATIVKLNSNEPAKSRSKLLVPIEPPHVEQTVCPTDLGWRPMDGILKMMFWWEWSWESADGVQALFSLWHALWPQPSGWPSLFLFALYVR